MKNFLNLMIGLAMLGGMVYFAFKALMWFYNQVLSIDPRISAALITGFLAIIATSLTITIPKYLEKKMEIDEHHREQKSGMYKELLEFLFKLFMGPKIDKSLSQEEIVEFMARFTENLILWGSEDVITKYRAYRIHYLQRELGTKTTMKEIEILENLLLAIRKDMGHKDKKLIRGDILSLFLNDIDQIIEEHKREEAKKKKKATG